MIVCVTGASGFVGMHVVAALLRAGHAVRATVRDPNDASKCGPLRACAPGASGTLTLHRGELMEAGSFREALDGAEVLVHVAAVAQLTAKDPQREIIDPAITGTKNVLTTAREVGTVRRLVLTSSVAAIGGYAKASKRPISAADWNDEATAATDPYPYAKTQEERLAREIGAAAGWGVASVNPVMVYGPVLAPAHLRASPIFVRNMLLGKMSLLPRINMGVVDVRDVADAHVAAVEDEQAPARRLLCAGNRWLSDIARALQPRYPGRKISSREIPNLLLYLYSYFDDRMTPAMAREMAGVVPQYDGSGWRYRDLDQTILDTAESMIPFLKK